MPKPSRKPLYAKAFTLYCEGKSLEQISGATGLAEHLLASCAESQAWEKRRGLIVGHKSVAAAETRIQAQIAVDSTLVRATECAASTLAQAYVKLIEEAAALPTHPFAPTANETVDENELYRQERQMIAAKAETMQLATKGLRELIETAQDIGLLKVEPNGKRSDNSPDDRPIDLSKLTQLNIAIVNATQAGRQQTQVVARIGEGGEPLDVTAR